MKPNRTSRLRYGAMSGRGADRNGGTAWTYSPRLRWVIPSGKGALLLLTPLEHRGRTSLSLRSRTRPIHVRITAEPKLALQIPER